MNAYIGKNVLITGGLGFIGSNLARKLVQEGAIVTLVDNLNPRHGGNLFNVADLRNALTLKSCDLGNSEAMTPLVKDADFIFNLAGQTSHIDSMCDPLSDLDINARAQLSFLETCREFNVRVKIVYASTRQIYGKADILPVNEKQLARPVDVNGINKWAGEQFHLLYNNVHGLRTCALRRTNTYGPGMRVKDARQTFLGVWLRCLVDKQPFQVFGDGLQLRDFNYVDDCVNALLLAGASEKANGNIYNLGGPEIIDLKSLAELMITLNGSGSYKLLPFPPNRKAIDIGDYYSDYSLIRGSLGWEPRVSLQEGLARTIEYYQLNGQHYWKQDQ